MVIRNEMDLPLQAAQEAAPPPPFLLHRPEVQAAPLILSSPHSGRHYPAAFLAESRLDPVALRRSEDGFVEEIFAGGLHEWLTGYIVENSRIDRAIGAQFRFA